jgi:hypothetical protein
MRERRAGKPYRTSSMAGGRIVWIEMGRNGEGKSGGSGAGGKWTCGGWKIEIGGNGGGGEIGGDGDGVRLVETGESLRQTDWEGKKN